MPALATHKLLPSHHSPLLPTHPSVISIRHETPHPSCPHLLDPSETTEAEIERRQNVRVQGKARGKVQRVAPTGRSGPQETQHKMLRFRRLGLSGHRTTHIRLGGRRTTRTRSEFVFRKHCQRHHDTTSIARHLWITAVPTSRHGTTAGQVECFCLSDSSSNRELG